MKISKDKLIIIFIYALLGVIAIGHIMQVSIIPLMVTGILICFSLLLKKENLLVMLYICLPFFKMLNGKLNTTSGFYILVVIFVIKYYISKENKYKVRTKTFILIIMLGIVFLNFNVIDKCLTWYISIMPLILTYKEKMLEDNILKIILYYTISMILASAYGYYLLQTGLYPFMDSYVWSKGQTYTRYGGMVGDSNIYSQCALLIISFNLIVMDKYGIKNTRYILIVLLMMFTIFTYSKMNILMMILLVVGYVLYTLCKYINKKNALKTIMVICGSIIGIIFIFNYIKSNMNSSIIESYITRFSAKDLLTGRTDVYDHFINLWKQNPIVWFFGIGFEKYIQPYAISSGMVIIYSHNIYIETISLFGGIVFAILAWQIITNIIKFILKKGNLLVLAPVMILLVTGFVLHGNLEFSYYYNIIIVIQLFVNEMRRKEIK